MNNFPGGIWPVMITPFTQKLDVDYEGLDRVTDWYLDKGVSGLFAVCQSSEMFTLSLEERTNIAKRVVKKASGKVPVIASGHISDSILKQSEELKAMADTGIDALILITNRFAGETESDEVWIENAEKTIRLLPPEIKLGLYECPYPYKRILSQKVLNWCLGTKRFYFLKDTSCDIENIRMKLNMVQNSDLKIYNANTATLLESLRDGVSGYSGVMGNMQPELYQILYRDKNKENIEYLSDFLTVSALIERQLYPMNAKYYLQLEGVPVQLYCRVNDLHQFTNTYKEEVRMIRELSEKVKELLMEAGDKA